MNTQVEKINIRGNITLLEVDGLLNFPRNKYKPSVVRATAHLIAQDTGKKFTVTTSKEMITVKRLL